MPNMSIRLAMRVEGDFWVAYIASEGTMDDAKRIGSIGMGAVANPERKQQFMDLMKAVLSDVIKEATGQPPTWNEPQRAPEAERAGRA